jgi:hypothetical protein
MFRDFLGCFKMFQDVLGDQLQLIQTPFQKSNPKRNPKNCQRFHHATTLSKNKTSRHGPVLCCVRGIWRRFMH